VDEEAACPAWAKGGFCTSNADYMSKSCRKACGLCGKPPPDAGAAGASCVDKHRKAGDCAKWAANGQCEGAVTSQKCRATRRDCHLLPLPSPPPCFPVPWYRPTPPQTAGRCTLSANAEYMADKCRRSCNLCANLCRDLLPDCDAWKRDAQCTRNRRFMAKHCQRTCGWCGAKGEEPPPGLCADEDIKCEDWAKLGECAKNAEFMGAECPRSCNTCQGGSPSSPGARGRPARTAAPTAEAPTAVPCVDHDRRCAPWAAEGGCVANPSVMRKTCPMACGACDHHPQPAEGGGAPEVPRPGGGCEDTALARGDCASMARSHANACSSPFMVTNCRATCGWCLTGRGQRARRGPKDEL
jgi:hypothetical protein